MRSSRSSPSAMGVSSWDWMSLMTASTASESRSLNPSSVRISWAVSPSCQSRSYVSSFDFERFWSVGEEPHCDRHLRLRGAHSTASGRRSVAREGGRCATIAGPCWSSRSNPPATKRQPPSLRTAPPSTARSSPARSTCTRSTAASCPRSRAASTCARSRPSCVRPSPRRTARSTMSMPSAQPAGRGWRARSSWATARARRSPSGATCPSSA